MAFEISDEIGITENYTLSYPHGRFNAEIQAIVASKGISTVGTSLVGGINSETDQAKIPRIPVFPSHPQRPACSKAWSFSGSGTV